MTYPKIYFNEALHKYTDEYGNVFKSVTTVIGSYVDEFKSLDVARACERIGRNPNHPKYLKYKGKTAQQLIKEWEATTEEALDNGNKKHNYLEDVVKYSNNYKRIKGAYINDRLFTITEIKDNPEVGVVTLDKLIQLELHITYPTIYKVIEAFVNDGWKLYSEIGVFNVDLLISGLIDLLLVKGDKFVILDWKTNKAPIMFSSGYFEKDFNGNLTDNFIEDRKTLKHPLLYVPASVGHKYSLQLSGYTYLAELLGFTLANITLCHIRTIDEQDVVNFYNIQYMRNEIELLFNHYASNRKLQNQKKLFV